MKLIKKLCSALILVGLKGHIIATWIDEPKRTCSSKHPDNKTVGLILLEYGGGGGGGGGRGDVRVRCTGRWSLAAHNTGVAVVIPVPISIILTRHPVSLLLQVTNAFQLIHSKLCSDSYQ